MNRRNAIYSLAILSVSAISAISIFKIWRFYKIPNLNYIHSNKQLIAEIAETIIPSTQSPGAKDAKTDDFILRMVTDCMDLKSQSKFIDGLMELEKYTKSKFGKTFQNCSLSDRITILTHFETKNELLPVLNKIRFKVFGEDFITLFKKITVIGYCTSEIGAKQGLSYDYIPKNYLGCTTLFKNQKAWATK